MADTFTRTVADAALKYVYEEMVRAQINTSTVPLYNKITPTSKNIVLGKKVIKAAPYGVNGGVGSGTETGALPTSGGNNYKNFESDIKLIFGSIELSDLVMEATKSDRAAFINALTSEMKGVQEALKFDYGRQLHMDGVGKLSLCETTSPASLTVNVATHKYFIEGQIIDIRNSSNALITNGSGRRISAVNRHTDGTGTIVLSGLNTVTTANTDYVTVQGSYNIELTGLAKILVATGTLYGLDKDTYPWMKPYLDASFGAISDKKFIKAIRAAEKYSGCKIDYLTCDDDVEAEYYEYLESTKRTVNTLKMEGGFKDAISISGIPLVVDRFVSDATIEGVDSSQYELHTLADWQWMEGYNGNILVKVEGYAIWRAVMKKYAELMCNHPAANMKLSAITIT